MNNQRPGGDLSRFKWATVVLPLVFFVLLEVFRETVLDRTMTADESHLAALMIIAGAILTFAFVVGVYLDRTQRQIVAQNKDLTVTHAVSSAVRGGLSLSDVLEQALDRMVTQTAALAGQVTITAAEEPLTIRRPASLAPGLAWVGAILDEPADPAVDGPRYSHRPDLDTGVMDLPLIRGAERIGHLRLAFHPPFQPEISEAAFADIAGEIAGAAQLGLTVVDLHRRERERAVLYAVALQLTGRNDLREVLDTITTHARDLLGAERAIVCLADAREAATPVTSAPDRIAIADDGGTCLIAHGMTPARHARNPNCPLVPPNDQRAWAARPMRGPDSLLGELCVVRAGRPFSAQEKTLLGALADMAAIAVRTARLHEAEEQWTIHAERDRIARELHDSLAQVLGVIHLQLRSLESRAKDEASHEMAAELSDIAETADEAYRDVREAILGLRETVREDDGLEGSLREYLRKYSRQTGISATVSCEGDTRRALSPRSEVQLLRVVQEALTNTRKHSRATRVAVKIDCTGQVASLTIEDDGVGFDPSTVARSMEGGFGLASMRERVEQIGGRIAVHTAPNEGTTIRVELDPEDTRGTPSAQASSLAGR
ncbi:MAG TPA: GAF domain-containing sensor histidine kinase [Candidatus Limnocylindrales bacterium]